MLADIFERLGYMERKGSGFGKIIESYEYQVHFREDKRPYLRSDRASFYTIMPNLNYEVQNVARDVARDVAQKLSEIIYTQIQKNNKVTRDEIAELAQVSRKTVEHKLKEMKNINYVGRGSNGHWEIADD